MKILFIHGFASSGAYKMAASLRLLFSPCEVIAPDVPIEPEKALPMLLEICETENPDLVIGLSLGGFWAQKLRGHRKILVNPDLHVSQFLRTRMGVNEYLSPRVDGALTLTVTPEICDAYERLEQTEFDGMDEAEIALTTGMFADNDELIHCGPEFAQRYPGRDVIYPGKHLPVYPELKNYLVPVVKRQLGLE